MGTRRLIIAADDDDVTRELVAATLSRGPFEVVCVADGAAALALARQRRPDLLLLDAQMPRMHGFEVCGALKADPATRGIHIILLTGLAQDQDRDRALELGADGYMTKPFSPSVLLRRVREVLGE